MLQSAAQGMLPPRADRVRTGVDEILMGSLLTAIGQAFGRGRSPRRTRPGTIARQYVGGTVGRGDPDDGQTFIGRRGASTRAAPWTLDTQSPGGVSG